MIAIVDPTFEVLDALDADALALFISTERKALRGAVGLVDWRLCGALSRSLLDSGFEGEVGERLIMPTRGRVAPSRLVLFGSGRPTSNLDSESFAAALDAARRAGFMKLAVELPLNIDAQVAIDVLSRCGLEELTLLGPGEALANKLQTAKAGTSASPREAATRARRR